MLRVCFVDSGVGGLQYCDAFLEKQYEVQTSYIADTEYFPYGVYEVESLKQRLAGLSGLIINILNPNVIVFACNTASVIALEHVRKSYAHYDTLHFVGVVPAIRSVQIAGGKRMYMMSTSNTTQNSYTHDLLKEYASDIRIFLRGFPELVENIEKMILLSSHSYLQYIASLLERIALEIKSLNIDSVVLACTHFLFIKKQLERLLPYHIKIYHSIDGVVNRIITILDKEQRVRESSFENKKEKKENTTAPVLYTTDEKREGEFKTFAETSHYQYAGIIS